MRICRLSGKTLCEYVKEGREMNVPKKEKEKVLKDESVDGIKRKILKGSIKSMHGLTYFGKGKPFFLLYRKRKENE